MSAPQKPLRALLAEFSWETWPIVFGELSKRDDLRVLLAHGAGDAVCPVEESRSIARTLDEAHRPAQYVEFDGPHRIMPPIVSEAVEWVTTGKKPADAKPA